MGMADAPRLRALRMIEAMQRHIPAGAEVADHDGPRTGRPFEQLAGGLSVGGVELAVRADGGMGAGKAWKVGDPLDLAGAAVDHLAMHLQDVARVGEPGRMAP